MNRLQLRLMERLQAEAKEVSLIEPLAVVCEACGNILKCPVWRMKIRPDADLPCDGEERVSKQ